MLSGNYNIDKFGKGFAQMLSILDKWHQFPVDYLWDDKYTFVPKLKQIFNDYIHGDKTFKGKVEFEEIGKFIEYRLPNMNNKTPLFVIRM